MIKGSLEIELPTILTVAGNDEQPEMSAPDARDESVLAGRICKIRCVFALSVSKSVSELASQSVSQAPTTFQSVIESSCHQ